MLLSGSLLGLAAGFIMHRADFCLTGMFRDLFLFGSTFKLRILFLSILVSMVLFEAARLGGVLQIPFPLFGSPSLTAPLGGAVFGIGMVLAGGCVVGSLYKAGAGSIPSMVAIVGIIAGSAFFAEIFLWWRTISAATTVFAGKVTLAELFGTSPLLPVGAITAMSIPWVIGVHRKRGWSKPLYAAGSLQPWIAALLLAGIGLASCIVIGMPLGITTSYAKAAAAIEATACPGHYASLTFFQAKPLNYSQPLTGERLRGGPGKELDAISLIQYPLIFGIVVGSAISALMLRELRIRWQAPPRQYLSAAVGGFLMGLASRMAAGCNVWHLLGGLPIMALQSMLFLLGLFPGTWLGVKFLTRFVIR